jgi:phospholipid transport system transporter-binding protein
VNNRNSSAQGFELINRGNGDYALKGELTFATASAALKATARLFRKSAALRFDLEGVGRTDSAGVALLIEWVRCARRSGGELRYANFPEHLRAIARVGGVADILPLDAPRPEPDTTQP